MRGYERSQGRGVHEGANEDGATRQLKVRNYEDGVMRSKCNEEKVGWVS